MTKKMAWETNQARSSVVLLLTAPRYNRKLVTRRRASRISSMMTVLSHLGVRSHSVIYTENLLSSEVNSI